AAQIKKTHVFAEGCRMESSPPLEQRTLAHHDAPASPWMRELGLIESIVTGFINRAEQSVSDLPHLAITGLELAGSVAAGAGLRIMAEAGGPWTTAGAGTRKRGRSGRPVAAPRRRSRLRPARRHERRCRMAARLIRSRRC